MKKLAFFIIAISAILAAFIGCAGQLHVGPLALQSPVLVKKSLVLNPADKLALDFSWADRRPIAIWHLSDPSRVTKENPAGWLDPTASGQLDADTYLARALPVVKEIGAQGVICWDAEGSGFDPNELYVGSPDQAASINPAVAYDAFFKRIRDAGLIPGVLLRATEFIDGRHIESADPYTTLLRKATYARQRWKCRLFYCDSNGQKLSDRYNGWADGPLISATVFARLHKAIGDGLFPAEHWDRGNYHRVCAPYMELRRGYTGTPQSILDQIPSAFSVINVSGGDIDANATALRASIARGEIIAVDAWWPNRAELDRVKALYAPAGSN